MTKINKYREKPKRRKLNRVNKRKLNKAVVSEFKIIPQKDGTNLRNYVY